MEAAKPSVAQLRSGVKLIQVSLRDTVEVHSLVDVQSSSYACLGSLGRAA